MPVRLTWCDRGVKVCGVGVTERSYGGKTPVERSAERRARLIEATIAVLHSSGEARATDLP